MELESRRAGDTYICVRLGPESHRDLRRPTPFLTDQGSPGSLATYCQGLDGRQCRDGARNVKKARSCKAGLECRIVGLESVLRLCRHGRNHNASAFRPKLRARLRALAKETDRSVHSLIVEAVERHAAYEEQLRSLVKGRARGGRRDRARRAMCYAAADVHAWDATSCAGCGQSDGPSRGGSSLLGARARMISSACSSSCYRENPIRRIATRRAAIQSAVDNLAAHPLVGRRIEGDLRELVISFGATGYIATLIASWSRRNQVRVVGAATPASRSAIYPDPGAEPRLNVPILNTARPLQSRGP